ncbi:penicillin-binding protein [Lactococcus lactis]|uniref:penicillin-binding protein n=1 Tax=Lactococcus lactis TaxID=1358 RepID=UPI002890EE6B|nr:penicillin-binding protein [Lactococcus lactis]MDT2885151.1 penicillin-binding protein [Lactococcus lactis]
MLKILKKIMSFPFRRISKSVSIRKNQVPEKNRKKVGKSLLMTTVILFMLITFRFVWIITTNHIGNTNLKQMSRDNYQATVTVPAKRGTIFDRNGKSIALDSSTYTIYAVIDENQLGVNGEKLYIDSNDFNKVENLLNHKLGIDRNLIKQQLNSKMKQVQFGSKGSELSLEKMQEIKKEAKKEKIVGLGFTSNISRSYPFGNFASQFIGVARVKSDKNGSTLKGDMGLEKAFNDILGGKNGRETYQKDISGRTIPGTTKVIKPVQNGKDVYTTLDSKLQERLESYMNKAAKDSNAQQLLGVLVNAHTGDILATSQRPTYTPTTINEDSKQVNFTWNNLLSQSAFEPGSTFKNFFMAAALDTNKVDLNQTFQRSLKVSDVTINDWDVTENKSYVLPETVTNAQGFYMSSNIGMSKLEMNMGYDLWNKYINKFKFGLKVRSGLDGEVPGILPSANIISQIESSFGQGIAVTPIQLLRGFTAFSNEGTMLQPHIVSKLVDNNKKTEVISKPEVVGHPIPSTVANKVLNMMLSVNTDPIYGTSYSTTGDSEENIPSGPLFLVNGEPAAVKTGTAQIASTTGGYMTGKQDYLYSAVVMYPSKKPDFIFYMYIKIPTNTWTLKYISRVANPLLETAESMKDSLSIDNEKEENNKHQGRITIANYVGKNPGDTADSLRRLVISPVIIGTGEKVTAQSISIGKKVEANSRILLLTNDKEQVMPDIYGWSKKDVEQLSNWFGIKLKYEGNGNIIINQSIESNKVIKKGQPLIVSLGNSNGE